MGAETDAALINASSQMITNASNAWAAADTDAKDRKWAEKMYQRQRNDALSDWDRQNSYNTPQAQMARLRDANLNPHLVYGNGADATAGPMRATDTPEFKHHVPNFDFDGGAVLGSYYDTKIKEATVNNLAAQNDVLLQEALLKAANTANVISNTDKTKFDLGMASKLAESNLQSAALGVKKLGQEIDIAHNQDQRAASLQIEQILTMKKQRAKTDDERRQIEQQITNLKTDKDAKELDIQLKKSGDSNAPWYIRKLSSLLRKYGITLDSLGPDFDPGIESND